MPEIREIQIRELSIPSTPDWLMSPSQTVPVAPAVTINIGTPIVDLPGCVEAHPDGGPQLTKDDPRGARTYCDGTVPSFNPIEYNEEQMLYTQKAGIDSRRNEEDKTPETPELPIPKTPPSTASVKKVECPTEAQEAAEPVGTYIQGFRKKVTGYKLVDNQCIQITEKVSIPEQIVAGVPSAGSVVTTGGIAVVATASALLAKPLADILLKVVKPTIKKVMKKIATLRRKTLPVLSVSERRDEQRIRSHAIRKLKGKE
jgi:hypothetical protein